MPQKGMCATCQHFDVRKEYQAGIPAATQAALGSTSLPNLECGTCRRFPPLASVTAASVWPIVREDEWCSEWKMNERPDETPGPDGAEAKRKALGLIG